MRSQARKPAFPAACRRRGSFRRNGGRLSALRTRQARRSSIKRPSRLSRRFPMIGPYDTQLFRLAKNNFFFFFFLLLVTSFSILYPQAGKAGCRQGNHRKPPASARRALMLLLRACRVLGADRRRHCGISRHGGDDRQEGRPYSPQSHRPPLFNARLAFSIALSSPGVR